VQLIIHDNHVLATYPESQRIDAAFLDLHHPGCEAVSYAGNLALNPEGETPDPRTDQEKTLAYRDRRRTAYPPIGDQLDMIYWDRVNGTTVWPGTIAAVKQQYPKPQA
jgi:hypothetical protein